ncbi:NAD(P)-binding protein [Athelia psychrophila]|uniref:NAD(P)-binding protein n=1 Tax=Athelia psychrophila TaxID=1759441 RepID=A0A167VPR1_9AGAM|nr:NAD(P)-binding protein [Fibularhizoctonia sp. CBS 109695]
MAARSSEAATTAIAQLKAITGREALFIKIDLSDPRSVKAAAEEFLSKEVKLHVLFNNGGVMVPPLAQVSEDGYDYSWATNVMGPYLLTTLLLPALLTGATSAGDGKARVVNTCSVMHHLRAIDFDALVDGPARLRLGGTELYCQSKNAIVVFSKELARRYGDRGIVSTAVNPGNLNTELMRNLDSIDKIILKLVTYPARYGALTPLYAGTAAGSAQFNGKYFIPWAHEGVPRLDTQDDAIGKKLWSWLDEHTQTILAKQ